MRFSSFAVGLALVVGVLGCRRDDDAGSSAGGNSPLRQEAVSMFSTRCTPCHGERGAGDGPASAGLTPRPRNFGDAAWQESVTDDHIATVIRGGGPAAGKSPAMPPNPDLASKPALVTALVAHVRSLRR